MFRQKPPSSPTLPSPVFSEDWAHGFHYLARQADLLFGQNRRPPLPWRPGVSLARRDAVTLILPATRKANPDFFHLKAEDVCVKRKPQERPTDSYLSHQYESVPHDRLIENGVLRHGLRLDIAHWLQQRRGGSDD